MIVEEVSSENANIDSQKNGNRRKEVGTIINQEPFVYIKLALTSVKKLVDARLVDNAANHKLYQQYLDLPLVTHTRI